VGPGLDGIASKSVHGHDSWMVKVSSRSKPRASAN
jgi:hypothetical protein